MKQLRFALILLNSLLLAITFVVVIFPSGCTKETLNEPVLEEPPEDYANLAAYFSGFESVLYVLPEYREQVLASLGADMVGEQEAVANLLCYDGKERLCHFAIVQESTRTALIAQASNARTKAAEKLKQMEDKWKERPADKQSYYGCECQPVPEKYGTCHVIGDKSSQTYKYPRGKCKRVSGSQNVCWEVNTLGMAEERIYNNRNCEGKYTIKELFEWVCRL